MYLDVNNTYIKKMKIKISLNVNTNLFMFTYCFHSPRKEDPLISSTNYKNI